MKKKYLCLSGLMLMLLIVVNTILLKPDFEISKNISFYIMMLISLFLTGYLSLLVGDPRDGILYYPITNMIIWANLCMIERTILFKFKSLARKGDIILLGVNIIFIITLFINILCNLLSKSDKYNYKKTEFTYYLMVLLFVCEIVLFII